MPYEVCTIERSSAYELAKAVEKELNTHLIDGDLVSVSYTTNPHSADARGGYGGGVNSTHCAMVVWKKP